MTDAEDAAIVKVAVDHMCRSIDETRAIHPKHWLPHIQRARECWAELGNRIYAAGMYEGGMV